jgi:molybdopterin/thiamine biosynthesis adenylyltransferase
VSATAAPERRREWYEAQPERLEWELAEFATRGLPVKHWISAAGRLVIETQLAFRGEYRVIRIVFPFDYPDVEPRVYGPLELLDRHQNRRVGNFCLLEDPTRDWSPTMSAAELVDEDLRWLLADTEAGPAAVAAGEADMPEPLSQHIETTAGQVMILAEPFWQREVAATSGELTLVKKTLGRGHVLLAAEGFGHADRELVGTMTSAKGERNIGRWTTLPDGAVGPWPSHDELLQAGETADPRLLDRHRRRLKRERTRAAVDGWVGLTFDEEGPSRGQRRRGWAFLHVQLDRSGNRRVLAAARALAFTASERARRVPELRGLADARVLAVGAGSLGAPVIFELAKAGTGHVGVVDSDTYDVNNAVRHVLDPRWAGVNKAIATSIEAEALNPFITVEPHDFHIGGGRDESERLDALIAQAEVVLDTTGSQAVARILSARCREARVPLVVAGLTAGSYGGEVVHLRPDGPCFWCFVLGEADGSVPSPAEGPPSATTPVGCATPAFAGAGFDAAALAALAARTVVQATGRTDYPSPDVDYVVVNFRGEQPWRQGRLQRHAGCPSCPT